MLPTVFAVRTIWVAILFILVIVSVGWFVVRAVVDFTKWFKEEIIDDFREHRRKKKARKAKRKVEEQ